MTTPDVYGGINQLLLVFGRREPALVALLFCGAVAVRLGRKRHLYVYGGGGEGHKINTVIPSSADMLAWIQIKLSPRPPLRGL